MVPEQLLPYLVLPLHVRVDLGVLPIKSYTIFPKALELEFHDQVYFSVKWRTLVLLEP